MAPSSATPDAANAMSAPSPAQGVTDSKTSTPNGQPPRKKLKLNLRRPSNDGDTIAVSRPKRKSAGRARYSIELEISDNESEEDASPAESSDLSSLDSKSQSAEGDTPAAEQIPEVSRQKSYGDFASYYIMDGDSETEEPNQETKSKPTPTLNKIKMEAKQSIGKPVSKASREKTTTQSPPVSVQPSIETRPPPSMKPVALKRPAPRSLPPPQLAPQQQSRQMHPNMPMPVHMQQQRQMVPTIPPPEPPVMEEIKVLYHAPVSQMVKNLQDLSQALTSFGGVPAAQQSPSPQKPTPAAPVKVDTFLALFDDDSDPDEDQGKKDNDRVKNPGEQDAPLTYGIQFIMNALKSWAQQRLYNAQLQGQLPPAPHGTEPPHDPYDLRHTLEGKAIAAFRRVVESGCLQVNAVLPTELSSALRRLYVQIDVLINSGNKPQQSWAPLSYSAQIAAHETRSKKILDQQARAHQVAQEQHKQAHEQMMLQMGMVPVPHGHAPQHMQMQPRQPQDSQRRRSSAHAHQQRVPTPQGTPVGFAPSPGNGHGPYPPPQFTGSPMYNTPPQYPGARDSPQGAPNNGSKNHLDRVQMYMPGLLPRSQQQMKFSFAPTNAAAVQAFGPQSFPPATEQVSNMPNRGPMVNPTPPPAAGNTAAFAHNSAASMPRPSSTPSMGGKSDPRRESTTSNDRSTPVINGKPATKRTSMVNVDSPAPVTTDKPAAKRGSMTNIDGPAPVTNSKSAAKRSSTGSIDGSTLVTDGKPVAKRGSIMGKDNPAKPQDTVQQSSGFTPVNRPKSRGSITPSAIAVDGDTSARPKRKRKSKVILDSPTTAPTLHDPNRISLNGTTDTTPGFPHPAAVVVDKRKS